MDEDDRKHLLSALRATVASQKGGVELQVLNSDYRELEGQNIPFRVLGFPTLEAYIRSLSNDFSIVPKQGSLYVMAKKNEALAHLQDLISGQNNKKKTTKKPAYKSSRGKFTGYNTSFNNRSYQHKSAPVTGSNSYGRVTNSTYRNSGSKPARAGSSSYHDRYQAHDSGYSAPARQASPVRKKSPPRAPERSEAATSASRRREPARHEPARHEPARHEPVTQEKHRNLDERQQEKRVPPTIKKMPAPLLPSPSSYPSQPIPRLLSQLQSQKEDNANHLSKNSNYTAPENLKITLRNDLCVSVPAGLERLQKPPPPLPPPHLYTSPRMDLDYYQLPMQSTIATPSLPSPMPSPSLSLHNGASSSKSSTPEVYEEPPVGSTPEEKLAHLSKYLFNEEPDVHIKHRQPDPRRKTFAYYAYVQVGSQPRISTLPNEYSTKEEARKSVVLLASNQLNKLKDERMAKALKKTTEKLNILIDRIYSLVRPSNNGLVATTVEELYEKKYEETMPPNWTTFPEVLSHPRLEVSSNAMCTIIYAKTLNSEVYNAGASLPSLELPEDGEWPVYVNLMTSVSTVYVRLADDSFDTFIKMSEDLDTFMNDPVSKPEAVQQAEVGGLYCLQDDDVWHRVQVEERREGRVVVRFIDHGEESVHALEKLYPLYDMFRTLPAQAVELLLPECQVFADLFDHHSVEAQIVGRTLVAVPVDERGEFPISATLYDTDKEPNVNINHFVFEQICGLFNVSSLPEENMFKECVFVSYISSNDSCVYVQVESLMFQYLMTSIQKLVESQDLSKDHGVSCAAGVSDCREEIFLARYELDGEYYRARLLEVNPLSNNVTVLFIDYGNTSLVSCNSLIKLFETPYQSHLCLIPPQAKKVKLVGLEVFTPQVMEKLTTLLNGTEPVILKMSAGRAQIHKRDRDGKIVNINSLVLNSTSGYKESPLKNSTKDADTGPLESPVIPPLNHVIDVLVETISSPTNFWIRPEESYNKWVELVEEMDAYYEENEKTLPPVRPEHIKVGACFAFPYEELDLWQRVTINSRISPDIVALFLADLGKIITADTSRLRYLLPKFRSLPAIAIKSKLHGIKPAFGDWTPADIVRFQAMCEPRPDMNVKVFKCCVESTTPDLVQHGEEDVLLSVKLLDTHGEKDIDLASCLVVEGRAKTDG